MKNILLFVWGILYAASWLVVTQRSEVIWNSVLGAVSILFALITTFWCIMYLLVYIARKLEEEEHG